MDVRCVHEVAAEGPVVDYRGSLVYVAEGGSKLRDGYERIYVGITNFFSVQSKTTWGEGIRSLCARVLRLVVRQMLHFSIMALIAVQRAS